MRSTIVSEEPLMKKRSGDKPWWKRCLDWFTKGRGRRLRREQFLAVSPQRVFAFLADASNLERTTPPTLHFQVQNELPLTLELDTLLDLQWKFLGRTFCMQSRVAQLHSPGMIEEVQQQGPFRKWHYVRRLKNATGGTWAIDELEYHLPWGLFGTLLDRLVVRRKLEHLFDFRQAKLIELLLSLATEEAQAAPSRASRARMRRPERAPKTPPE